MDDGMRRRNGRRGEGRGYLVDEFAHALAHRVGAIVGVGGRRQVEVEFLARERDRVGVEIGEVGGGLEFDLAVHVC